jgi:hypothetical protein
MYRRSAAPAAFAWGYHGGGYSGERAWGLWGGTAYGGYGGYHGAYYGGTAYHGAYYGGTAVPTPAYAGVGAAAAGAAVAVAATAYAAANTINSPGCALPFIYDVRSSAAGTHRLYCRQLSCASCPV